MTQGQDSADCPPAGLPSPPRANLPAPPRANPLAPPRANLPAPPCRAPLDVLIVSLGATSGLRAADEELRGALRRAGASVELVHANPPRTVRTLMLTDLAWALAARRAALAALRRTRSRAVIYSSTTAALLWPRPGAIRFDAPAAGNRPGRHGLWQRPLERRRLARAPLLLPWSAGALAELVGVDGAGMGASALVLPVPVERSEPSPAASAATGASERDIAAITYAANPAKKGLDRVLAAWARARREGEELVVAGAGEREILAAGLALPAPGVRVVGLLSPADYRALLSRARVFVTAPRREDYGLAQLEALAEGCLLVTSAAPGPYAALALARTLDPRLVVEGVSDGQATLAGEGARAEDTLAAALRTALEQSPSTRADYAERARRALAPFDRAALDELVAGELLPRLRSF